MARQLTQLSGLGGVILALAGTYLYLRYLADSVASAVGYLPALLLPIAAGFVLGDIIAVLGLRDRRAPLAITCGLVSGGLVAVALFAMQYGH